VVRVADPVQLTAVRQKLTELGFGSFSIVDELDQIRTVFLIIDSVLGLLGGISLLVASFGIANTMIMSILERTREIGIMKAIGAEDREIKLIFFVEAAVIGVVGGANIPNAATRFQHFAAGKMISSPTAGEAVVSERFIRDFGYDKPADAIGKTLELLAPPSEDKKDSNAEEEETPNFFGIPLDDPGLDESNPGVEIQTFRIAGVLGEIKEGVGQGGLRGLFPGAQIYIPLQMAHDWSVQHRSPMGQVALALARRGGNLGEGQNEGYEAAVVRVTDPKHLTQVRQKITELGFGSFSLVDEIDQIRTVFLIIDSVLGLLGGISLLVASFGIANTMIMSILERTREIGIMKAIGAEDREIKLIFFVEAAVIGVTGGVIGVLIAWGIDGLANRLAYRFILKPQGASFIDFFSLPIYLSVGAILFALVISILAALYPASRAARIDPVRALRHD
jgi:ABC-type antimicrobial peptide transport system permease subunit